MLQHLLADGLDQSDDPLHVFLSLTGKSHHQVKLQVLHTTREDHVRLLQDLGVGNPFVDGETEPIGTRLWRHRKSPLTASY